MKTLKQINIKLNAHINDEYRFVVDEVKDNLTEVKYDVQNYFGSKVPNQHRDWQRN